MAPMSCSESASALNPQQRAYLLELAGCSIRHGLAHGKPLALDASQLEPALNMQQASFVTLELRGQLRGCIGSLEALRPLAEDISANAYAAAFRDPRFSPVSEGEVEELELHVSLLTPAEMMQFDSQADLIRQLTPGIDGLILEEGTLRGTFLPSVWESLPEPVEFLRQLRNKAGLSPDYWSDTLRVFRYRTEVIG